MLALRQRGDTMVEVLISIAILSLVLSISYGLANRSSKTARQAQERAEALKISEAQMERLRIFIKGGGTWGANRCFSKTTNLPTPDLALNECGFGTDNRYGVAITEVPPVGTYQIITEWFNVSGTGTGRDNLTISNRLN